MNQDNGAPQKCKYCDKQCSNKYQLDKHEIGHLKQKPHKCTTCEATFSQKSIMKAHLLTHTGESC